MNLLIITQKVDRQDPILGFFHRWIIEFAKHCATVTVICLEKGTYDLPANVKVLSLGKEDGVSRAKYLARFYRYIWRERHNYDAVFVHMNPVYVLLGGFVWMALGKRISLWYTHKSVDLKLRLAEKMVDRVFTASKESFRLRSDKVMVTGHGIDTEMFAPREEADMAGAGLRLLSVSRISETKGQMVMIKSVEELADKIPGLKLTIVGAPITAADVRYDQLCKEYVRRNDLAGRVIYMGPVPQHELPSVYNESDMVLNLSATGSLDKAVLEAMACGLTIITSNEAFRPILPSENMTDGSIRDIAAKIRMLSTRGSHVNLREYVVARHSLIPLIHRLCHALGAVV